VILKQLKAFGAFWYDFIVGDDWRIAAGVVLVLAVTYALAHQGLHAVWWLPLLGVAVLLPWSVRRAVRKSRKPH
jgi:hypothetical protein